ncbi:putative secreted protein (Por secretion system target) [Ulvibacter sp. MAR_2010_11]|uniref:S8 family serine peptidase n=1 Tax=Ulvibacter sp. MAR_2010_11 TaxID=1250229 RepID=UPI000C2C95D5|nr:S8 family serine peptidase [Ulvibacter sp. MAR_2010_11]PKA83726.1 putative secreted protein (Por secretion system target) [Ulvibacter sp. MAR_2010_11]
MKKLLFLLVILTLQQSYAQTQDALVFFADKEDVAASIANPITIMTQEAIDRKALHDTPIDERDVPVNENYITQVKNATGISVYAKSKWMNCVYVRGSQSDIENLLNLAFVTDVEFADKSLNLFPNPFPTEDKFAFENQSTRTIYNYGAAANQTEMIAIDYVHEQDFTGGGMIVAVMDSGFPNVTTNPAFADVISENRLLGTYDFAERQVNVDGTGSHGSRTFSDIGAFLLDEFVGTAPEASFYLFRTEYGPSENPVEEAWWVEALERADSLGVDVINTSLGYRAYDNSNYDHTYADLDGLTTIAARGANHAFDKGMLLVTSAGNGGNSSFPTVGTPGDAVGILTIGAVTPAGNYASFSSIGPTVDGRIKPDVMAQGQDAAVVDQNGNVDFNNGTSFSSPIMAGAVASLWQARPELRNYQIMQIIRESANLYNNPTNQMGYGIPNFEDAYNAVITLGIEEEMLESQFALYPNPVLDRLNISFPKDVTTARIAIYNVLGEKVLSSEITPTNNVLNVVNLKSGIYIASIESNNKTNSYKIVKR